MEIEESGCSNLTVHLTYSSNKTQIGVRYLKWVLDKLFVTSHRFITAYFT